MTPENGVNPRGGVVFRYSGSSAHGKHPDTGLLPYHLGPWGGVGESAGDRKAVLVPPAFHPRSGTRKAPGCQASRRCASVALPQGGAPSTTRGFHAPPVKEKAKPLASSHGEGL